MGGKAEKLRRRMEGGHTTSMGSMAVKHMLQGERRIAHPPSKSELRSKRRKEKKEGIASDFTQPEDSQVILESPSFPPHDESLPLQREELKAEEQEVVVFAVNRKPSGIKKFALAFARILGFKR